MKRPRPMSWGPAPAALTCALAAVLVSCDLNSRSEATTDPNEEAGPSLNGVSGFFAPRAGETWTYRVEREIPLEFELTAADQALGPRRTETTHLVSLERVRRCAGVEEVEGLAEPVVIFDVIEGDLHQGRELFEINQNGLIGRGYLSIDPEGPNYIFPDSLTIAKRPLHAGFSWDDSPSPEQESFSFRVVERTQITVPAGTFDVAKIRITGTLPDGTSSKRVLWFAEDVGIVKEEVSTYGPDALLQRERAELVSWLLPADGQEPDA